MTHAAHFKCCLMGLGHSLIALLCLSASAVHAQNPGLAWNLNFVDDNTNRLLFAGRDAADQPDFRPSVALNRVLRTSNGSYVLIPTNSADLPDVNALVAAPPAWPGTRGWQILRLDDNGALQWKRFIASPSARIDGAKVTAEQGLAFLQNNQLVVFDPNGSVTYQVDISTQICAEDFGRFSGDPDRQFLTDEQLLVVNFAGDVTEQPRACAINYSGNIIDRVSASSGRLEVGDYRRDAGFLTKEGDFLNGFWSNSRFELRSQNQTQWSLADADAEIMRLQPQIAADRSTLIIFGGRFRRISPLGVSTWDVDPAGFQNVAFTGPNRLLMSNAQSAALRSFNTDGDLLWEVNRAPWTDSDTPAFVQIDGGSFIETGYQRETRTLRVRSYTSSSGIETRQINVTAPADRPILSFGALGTNAAVLINSPSAPTVVTNPFAGSCSLSGFCPTGFAITSPSVLRYNAAGQLSADLGGLNLAYPLPTRPLESRPGVQLLTGGSLIHLSYGHDGQKQDVLVRRVSADGQVTWTRRLSAGNFDAERASFAIVNNSVFVTAHIGAPGTAAGNGTLWELNSNDGSIVSTFTVPKLQEMHAVLSTPSSACSLGPESSGNLLCISPGQSPQIRNLTLPVGTGPLSALGVRSDGKLRARRLSAGVDRFTLLQIAADGTATTDADLIFDAPGGTPLRVDQLLALSNGEFIASAQIGNSGGNSAVIAAVVAQFSADGTRQWQSSFFEPQRPFQNTGASSLNTVLARASNGDVYLGIQGQDVNPLLAPVKVCRTLTGGTPAGCFSAPRAGRVVALLPDSDSTGVFALTRSHPGNTIESQLSSELFRVNAGGFSNSLLLIPGQIALSSQSLVRAGDALYLSSGTLNNFGVYIDRPTGNAGLQKINLGLDAVFQNGFED